MRRLILYITDELGVDFSTKTILFFDTLNPLDMQSVSFTMLEDIKWIYQILITNLETITLNEQTNYRSMEIGKITDYFDQEIKDQQILVKN